MGNCMMCARCDVLVNLLLLAGWNKRQHRGGDWGVFLHPAHTAKLQTLTFFTTTWGKGIRVLGNIPTGPQTSSRINHPIQNVFSQLHQSLHLTPLAHRSLTTCWWTSLARWRRSRLKRRWRWRQRRRRRLGRRRHNQLQMHTLLRVGSFASGTWIRICSTFQCFVSLIFSLLTVTQL